MSVEEVLLSALAYVSILEDVTNFDEGHCIPREYTFQLKAINAINATINRAMFYRH